MDELVVVIRTLIQLLVACFHMKPHKRAITIKGNKVLMIPINSKTNKAITTYAAHLGISLAALAPSLLVDGITSGSIAT